jgi:hypothetical protein
MTTGSAARKMDDSTLRSTPAPDQELIDTGTSKRYVRRDKRGRFTGGQVVISSSRRRPNAGRPKGAGDTRDRRPTGG